ncbi:ABC transporter permease [Hyphomicrobium methylovorum]|uniref:FecCD family ABC transporter permease n=1 Tax=Hyphomicrobium methylovorum TaxID=84 RepID=UPI001FE5348E|nr:iron ABC transporter permease [Hyphomicrobium methylovorum]MBA2124766.1 ABC transporter permease [Hyphomicrobium methylovorum]
MMRGSAKGPMFLLGLILLGAMILSLTLGRYPLSIGDISAFFQAAIGLREIEPVRYALLQNIIVEIRLPRILAAVLIGAALSISGAAFQAVFRNPLVSPGILGVLGGAGFGAAIGLLISGHWIVVQLMAFAMAILAVGLAVLIARLFGTGSMLTLILGGIISSALFTAMLSIVKYTADPYNQLPAIVYWLMGSLQGVELKHISIVVVPILAGIVGLTLCGRALDALSMGDDEARALGVPVKTVRYGVIVAATLVSALSVSIAGIIGWIGLVIPNFARLLFGPANARLIPLSAMLGALFLLCADCLARALTPAEIPIGIVTELLGIPALLFVLGRARRAWV